MSDVFIGGFRTQQTGEQAIASYIWDIGTLSWVPQTSTSGGTPSTSVNITNSSLPVTQAGSWTVNIATTNYSKRFEQVSTTLAYFGQASVGASESSSVWQIQKLDFTTGVIATYAGGSDAFNNVWTNRASYTYS